MLRNLFIIAILAVGLRFALEGPYFALLFYLWNAYFRPETWIWDPWLGNFRLSYTIGVYLLISTLFSGRQLRITGRTTLITLFLLQSLLSTLFSPYFDSAWLSWRDFAVIVLVSYLITILVTDRREYRLALLVVALSLGLEVAKQGWAGMVLAPGLKNENRHVALGDENGVAVGLLMIVPILGVLGQTATRRWEQYLHRFVAVGVTYRAIVTYSRGGFLACGAMAAIYLARSRRRLRAVAGVVLVASLILPMMPDEFWARMQTIRNPEQAESGDNSAASRFHFWLVALRMAAANPLTGVGHNAYTLAYREYDFSKGLYNTGRAVHSVWFGVLAESGIVGFLLFVSIIAMVFRDCERIRRLAKKDPRFEELGKYAVALETSFGAFAVGGLFVHFQYIEMLWHFIALSIALQAIAVREEQEVAVSRPVEADMPDAVQAGSLIGARRRRGIAAPGTESLLGPARYYHHPQDAG